MRDRAPTKTAGLEITLPEVCRSIGCTWARAYNLVLAGKLEARRVNGRYLISVASVKRWKRQNAAEAERPAAAAAVQ